MSEQAAVCLASGGDAGDVAGRIDGGDTERVVGAAAEVAVAVAGGRRGADLVAVQVRAVAGDTVLSVDGFQESVAEVWPTALVAMRRASTAVGVGCRGRTGSPCRPGSPLPRGQVVDPNLVDETREVLAVESVAADLELVGRGRDRPGLRLAPNKRAVHVEANRGPVIRDGDEAPSVRDERRRPVDVRVTTAERATDRRLPAVVGGRLEVVVVVRFVDDVAPNAARRRRD